MTLCRRHSGGPTLREFSESVQSFGERLWCDVCETQAEMRRHVIAVPGHQQDASFRGGLAERLGIVATEQPGKRCRSSRRTTSRCWCDRQTTTMHSNPRKRCGMGLYAPVGER